MLMKAPQDVLEDVNSSPDTPEVGNNAGLCPASAVNCDRGRGRATVNVRATAERIIHKANHGAKYGIIRKIPDYQEKAEKAE